jgi:hypothetical protein
MRGAQGGGKLLVAAGRAALEHRLHRAIEGLPDRRPFEPGGDEVVPVDREPPVPDVREPSARRLVRAARARHRHGLRRRPPQRAPELHVGHVVAEIGNRRSDDLAFGGREREVVEARRVREGRREGREIRA